MSNNTTRGRWHTLPPPPDYLPRVEKLLRKTSRAINQCEVVSFNMKSAVSLRNYKELLNNSQRSGDESRLVEANS